MNPKWRRWLAIIAFAVVAVVTVGLLRDREATEDAPSIQLMEVFQQEGQQWVCFRVQAPSNTVLLVQHKRLLGDEARESRVTTKESYTVEANGVTDGEAKDIRIEAPGEGLWRVRFLMWTPRKGLRLWLSRLRVAWEERTFEYWPRITYRTIEWESELITNAVPPAARVPSRK